MSKQSLKIISEAMITLGLNYAYMEYSTEDGKIPVTYLTGEYQEVPNPNEDGMQETTFILNGFTRGAWLELENAKDKIESYFGKVGGHTVIADNGTAVAVFYSNSLLISAENAELKRIQINLTIKEWSVK